MRIIDTCVHVFGWLSVLTISAIIILIVVVSVGEYFERKLR